MRAIPVLGMVVGVGLLVSGMLAGVAHARTNEPSPMTVEQTQVTMDAYAEALLGGGAYETFFAEDIVVSMVGTGQEIKGPAAAKAAIDAMHQVQFDAQPEITNFVVGPGQAALEADFIGTHTGEFAGIASTGKQVNVPYIVFYELKDDKITALRIYGLVDGLVQQLTAVERVERKNVGPIEP